MSQSLLDSHRGLIAGLNGWTNGCMSVEERSVFSYHVAAGRTMSECSGVDVILKSSDTSRSSFPSVSSSIQLISSGFSSLFGSASRPLFVPSRCLRKYSCPLAEDEMRFERQTNSDYGLFLFASEFSMASLNFLSVSASTAF